MKEEKFLSNNKRRKFFITIIILGLLISIGVNIYFIFFDVDYYLQTKEQIYIMEAGILNNNSEFYDGEDIKINYDFDNSAYEKLIKDYKIQEIAGNGTEFQKSLRVMNEFAPRLYHKSDYDNSIEISAIPLLEYSLDNKKHGINCRNKAQILNEICLALGIYSRKVWIMPNSGYDNDCHVVNEIWDTSLEKWIMLDITNNQYWVDENGMPLSILEIREKGSKKEFCTPVKASDDLKDLPKLKKKYENEFIYIMKNVVYMKYLDNYSINEKATIYILFPRNIYTDYEYIISKSACEKSPID